MVANTAEQAGGRKRWWCGDAGTSVGNRCWCSNPVVILREVLDDSVKSAEIQEDTTKTGRSKTAQGTQEQTRETHQENHNDLTT